MTEEIEEFTAKAESGREYTIVVTQEWHATRTHDDPDGKVAGLKSISTTEGHHVNFIDENTFKIVDTGEIVRRI